MQWKADIMVDTNMERAAGKPARKADASLIAKRVALTLGTAAAAGLTDGKKQKRLSGRAHEQLFEAAAAQSGLDGSDLLEYALAKVALEDDFAERLISLEGSIGRDIDLGF
jgi:hypothetical protein